jgi:hypothetical protein
MPIYDIFETKDPFQREEPKVAAKPISKKDRFFSSFTARLLFFVLLLGDICWAIYALTLCLLSSLLAFVTRSAFFSHMARKQWMALKRSSICGISLLIALFSPALGIMIACTYFLMYDKMGIQEVVPASLQEQFQEFLK